MRILCLCFFILIQGFSVRGFGNFSNRLEFGQGFPKSFQLFLEESLEQVFSVKGVAASPLHHQMFGGPVNGEVYQKWFHSRVQKIVLQKDECNYTAKIDSEGEPGVIYISSCVNLSPSEDQKMYWASVLFHEARHMESQNGFWKHEICVDEGSGLAAVCDSSPLSPTALEKVLFDNLVRHCLNCSHEMKSQALEIYESEDGWKKLKPKAQNILLEDRQK